jgi:hypothetical protein
MRPLRCKLFWWLEIDWVFFDKGATDDGEANMKGIPGTPLNQPISRWLLKAHLSLCPFDPLIL